jgi:hypothetical protein
MFKHHMPQQGIIINCLNAEKSTELLVFLAHTTNAHVKTQRAESVVQVTGHT